MSLAPRDSPPVANYLHSRVLSFPNAPAHPHPLPDDFSVMAYVCLLAARKLNYLSLSPTVDGISASAAGPCLLVW